MASVLVVDDERSIRATLAEFLREDGHVVRTAETALEAIEHIEADAPDVLVTDIVLPRMSGVELLSRVHQRHPQIQVIMITGEPTVATAVEAVRQGALRLSLEADIEQCRPLGRGALGKGEASHRRSRTA